MPDQPPVVLLLEDDLDTREMYALVLDRGGFTVVEASNAEQALDLLTRTKPAVIVSDIALPGADGFEFCQSVRRLDEHKKTPVIGITAVTLIQAMVQARRAGFDEMLTKPCTPDELLAAIQRHLNPPAESLPKPNPVKAEETRHTPTERAWRIRSRRFGDRSDD